MNPQASAADAYRRATLENAPPIKIVRMMYQGALRFLGEAAQIDPADDPVKFRDLLLRTESIVVELRISLEAEVAPELCAELERLYLFVEGKIREAVDGQTADPIEDARSVLFTLYTGWKEIEVVEETETPEAA